MKNASGTSINCPYGGIFRTPSRTLILQLLLTLPVAFLANFLSDCPINGMFGNFGRCRGQSWIVGLVKKVPEEGTKAGWRPKCPALDSGWQWAAEDRQHRFIFENWKAITVQESAFEDVRRVSPALLERTQSLLQWHPDNWRPQGACAVDTSEPSGQSHQKHWALEHKYPPWASQFGRKQHWQRLGHFLPPKSQGKCFLPFPLQQELQCCHHYQELFLNGNRISHLRQCDKYLPASLETLTLAKNNINDLNEISTLSGLCNLHSISISDNPCVQMTGSSVGFDYRPFVLNWCMSVKLIDGFVVTPIESLKAEWLYSQGRGRQFRVGEQQTLVRYLASVCPLSGETLESEKERKLRLILSKAQQHQRQLAEEISSNEHSSNNSPSSGRRKGVSSRIQSPRCKLNFFPLTKFVFHRIRLILFKIAFCNTRWMRKQRLIITWGFRKWQN